MGNCCYYLCCLGCCGICCQKRFAKSTDDRQKTKYLKVLKDITPEGLNRMSSTTDPTESLFSKLTVVHTIPGKEYRTQEDVLKGNGYALTDQKLGEGSFAKVFKVLHKKSGAQIACKVIELPIYENRQERRITEMKNELFVLQRANHPHLLKLIQHFIILEKFSSKEHNMRFFIFMQLAKNGTLGALSERVGPFDEYHCKVWFAQILSAINYMHGKGIAHRDLKLRNILLDDSQDALVSDFGLSRVVWRPSKGGLIESTSYCGTPPFMAPEVLRKKEVLDEDTKKSAYNAMLVDVWALGVILYRLFNKDYPFNVQNIPKALKRMRNKKWQFSGNNSDLPSDQLRLILKRLLEPDPLKRPTAAKLKTNPWVKHEYIKVEQKVMKLMADNTLKNSTIEST